MAGILRKKLALAVKNVHWSYAIFWSILSTPNGALEWDDGYYNGDIKTRKTVQAEQLNANELGLQRTEQLRELYESLLDAETNPQSARPSAALSPEDLTDTEWYFLVCMSFVFNIGQGLPGRSFAKNQTIWLCNVHQADSKVFSRTLLAKSASIKTVVCFPYSGGVIELGTTERVLEDLSIIQHITSFLETPSTVISNNSLYVSKTARNGNDTNGTKPDHNIIEANITADTELEKPDTCSPNSSSEDFKSVCEVNKLLTTKDVNEGASQIQSWQLMDDEISNDVLKSEDSSDCVSQTFASPEKVDPLQEEDNVNEDHLVEDEDCKDMEVDSVEVPNDDIHYQGIVSTLLKSSHQLIMGPCFKSSIKDSCFVRWKKGRSSGSHESTGENSQRLLKQVLYGVAQMHSIHLLETQDNNSKGEKLRKIEADEFGENHVLAEKTRIEKIQEKFAILGSIVPSSGKVDSMSLLDNTIDYLRSLEKKVEVLESQKDLQDMEERRKICDVIESSSDNYGDTRVDNSKKRVLKKRKASSINDMKAVNRFQKEDNLTDNVTVTKTGKNIVIEIKCPWREDLLLEIMSTTSKLHLDSHSVQSSNIDGNFSMTIKSEVNRSTTPSAKIIRQALQRVARKS